MGVSPASATDPDFQLTVQPSAQSLAPGTDTSFSVEVASIGGFADAVDLGLGDLPPGVSASISPTSIVPPGTATVHVTAGLGTIPGTYAITVVGTSGATRHESSGQATVDFGLTPICYGAFSGTVTDSVSGAVLADVPIFLDGTQSTQTDDAGHYSIPQVGLDSNNPTQHTVQAEVRPLFGYDPDAHWYEEQTPTAICGVPQTVDFALVPVARATIGGRVTVGAVVGADYAHPVSTGTAIDGATVSEAHSAETASAADGAYSLSPNLGYHNAPLDGAGVFVSADGYWPAQPNVGAIGPGDVVPLDVPLVPVCSGTMSGTLTDSATGEPIKHWTVNVDNLFAAAYATQTDDAGHYSLTETLDYNNAPIHYLLAGASGGPTLDDGRAYVAEQSQLVDVLLSHCGESQVLDLSLTPQTPATPNFGNLDGYVKDRETGQPLDGACVGPGLGGDCLARTDPTGFWHADHLQVSGDSSVSSVPFGPIDVTLDGYYRGSTDPFDLVANTTQHANATLLLRRSGQFHGVVLDAVTHLPVANADVRPSVESTTGPNGTFTSGPLPLGFDNAPLDTTVSAFADGYWPLSVPVTIAATTDPFVTVDLVPICKGATIAGRVVNAVTGDAIADADVTAGTSQTTTDADGRYRFDGVQVGDQNSPAAVELTASAAGFFTQTREVTVFCGASLSIDFGRAPPTGAIEGYVTDGVTGKPMAHVFVGSGFGGAAETDDSGYYHFATVPVNDDGTDRAWDVTAAPSDFDAQTKSAVVHAGATTREDFVFGATAPPPTRHLVFTETGLPSGTAWTPTLDGTTPAAATPPVYAVDVPDSSSVTFSAPPIVLGSATTRYVLREWRRTSDGGIATSPATAATDETYTASYAAQHAPVAADASFATNEGVAVDTPVTATDADGDALTFVVVGGPAHGTLSGTAPALRYTPSPGYSGDDSFTFEANDGTFDSNAARVSIVVAPVDQPPTCPDASFTTPQNKALTKTLVCADPENAPLTYTDVSTVAHGTLALADNGTFTYTPASGFVGTDSFTYRANDGSLDSNVAQVTISVLDVKPPTCSFAYAGVDSLGRTMYQAMLRDTGTGIASIRVTLAQNAIAKLPAFTPGTTKQLAVYQTATADPSELELDVKDVAGNEVVCDPLVAVVAVTRTVKAGTRPLVRTFVGVDGAQGTLVVKNGRTGLTRLEVVVNGHAFELTHLRSRQRRRLDLTSAMQPGTGNVISMRGWGSKRASATVALGN